MDIYEDIKVFYSGKYVLHPEHVKELVKKKSKPKENKIIDIDWMLDADGNMIYPFEGI